MNNILTLSWSSRITKNNYNWNKINLNRNFKIKKLIQIMNKYYNVSM